MRKSIIILGTLIVGVVYSQPTQTAEEFEKNYQRRILLESIDSVYIPKDLQEVFVELDKLTETTAREKVKLANEDLIASKLHFSLGRWMQLNWGFEQGSRLSHVYRLKGLSHTDDLIDLILRAWHRHLLGKPVAEEELIKNYIHKRKNDFQKRVESSEVLKAEPIRKPEHRE